MTSAAAILAERTRIVAMPTPLPRPGNDGRRLLLLAASAPLAPWQVAGRRKHLENARAVLMQIDQAISTKDAIELRAEQSRKPLIGCWYGVIGPSGGIRADRATTLFKAARPHQSVRITLTSEGGSVDETEKILTVMAKHRGQITIRVPSGAHSAATLLLSAADIRIASPNSRFKVHYPEAAQRRLTAATLRAIIPEIEAVQERFVDRLAMNCLQLHSKIHAMCAAEKMLSADEALRVGLVDLISAAV